MDSLLPTVFNIGPGPSLLAKFYHLIYIYTSQGAGVAMSRPTRITQEMIDECVSLGLWETTTMVDDFERQASECPQKEAVVDRRTRLTWGEVKRLSDRIALGLLKLGIERDGVIAVQLPNWVENFVLWVALNKAGILGSFPATTYRRAEMEQALRGLGAVGVIVPLGFGDFDYLGVIEAFRPRLPCLRHIFVVGGEGEGAISIDDMMQSPIEQEFPEDYLERTRFTAFEVSSIQLTSGSTGAPKLCEWLEAMVKVSGRGVIEPLGLGGDDVLGMFAPLSGGPGSSAWACAPQLGAKTVMLDRFDAEEAFRLIQEERITYITTVPALLVRMASYPHIERYDLSSLRAIRCGAAALAPAVAEDLERKLDCRIVPGSGAMDCMAFTQACFDDPPEVRHRTAGRPFLGNEVKMVDEAGREVPPGEIGEMWVRGACTGAGYYGDVGATIAAWGELGREGWYRTGDLAGFDGRGNVIFAGRKKDMIIRGGQNIYPQEIEAALLNHPQVREVAIVGMPDRVMGEKVCAFVIPRPGEAFTFEEMASFLRGRGMASFKIPERLEIRGSFPVLAGGQKVDKKTLAREIALKLKAEGRL
jgi:non-ribosomal peptide synthetase component E (peptide arylation enzyme)